MSVREALGAIALSLGAGLIYALVRLGMFLVAFLVLASSVSAEPTPLQWPAANRALARHLSDGLVYGAVGLDTWHSWRAEDRRHAFGCQALRMGLSIGANLAVKNLVHRERPDGSNNYSYYSGHSSNAMAASGWNYSVGVPLAFGAGYLRVASGKHYISDVISGLGVGFAVSKVCR